MTDQSLKIISLQAENIKKLVAVRIDPNGAPLVEITGGNGAGKTSVLDAIWWALGGLSNVQRSPIRKGQEKARVTLDLGELIVTRTFTRAKEGGEEFTSTITVESADGARYPSPQKALDSFLDALAFDPLEFARMKPADQFDALKGMVPGVDFEKLEGQNRADFDRRAGVNREIKDKSVQAAAIGIPSFTPSARVDENAIVEEISQVGEHNALIERRREVRANATQEAATLRTDATRIHAEADAMLDRIKAMREQAAGKTAKAEELETKLAEAEPLPEPKDAAEVRKRLDDAKRANAAFDMKIRRDGLLAEVVDLEAQSKKLTEQIDARSEAKRQAIAAAKLPVEGLGFGEKSITLNGLPFDQASDAEQLRCSLAIAMANNPRLRVIRVRDGSLLDDKGLAIVREMAGERDFQVWCERVDTSGKVGFYLENGEVRHAPEAPAHAQAAE